MTFVSQTFLPVQQFRGVNQEVRSFLGNWELHFVQGGGGAWDGFHTYSILVPNSRIFTAKSRGIQWKTWALSVTKRVLCALLWVLQKPYITLGF